MESQFFRVDRQGAVAHLIMSRPEKANGMNAAFWGDLPLIVDELNGDSAVRAMIISGEGRHFTSGADLGMFNEIMELFHEEHGRAAYAMRNLILKLQDSLNALERARFPVIAAIHGVCIGAGIDFITACDIRIASEGASFAIEEISVGMAADLGTLQRLPKLISPSIAAELAYTGRRFTAAEAHSFGLISQVTADETALMQEAWRLAQSIADRSPLAVAGIKRNLIFARDHPVAAGLDYIATWNGGMLRADDVKAAIQAKLSKQPAEFADLLPPKGLTT